MEVLVSFAQHAQDVILVHALKDYNPREVFWIDVGSNDPVNISVTLLFSMLGGHGINIEPQEMYRKRYENLRQRDINLFVGVGENGGGEMILYGSGDTATMTKTGNVSKAYKVPVVTLNEIFDKHVLNTQVVHFLKVDVEGFETEVIRGLDITVHQPWIICIECLEGENFDEYELKLLKNPGGYIFAYFDGQNRYYVRKDKNDIIENFKSMDNLNKYYEIVSMQEATKWLSYEQSTSWKITAPLRKLLSFFRK